MLVENYHQDDAPHLALLPRGDDAATPRGEEGEGDVMVVARETTTAAAARRRHGGAATTTRRRSSSAERAGGDDDAPRRLLAVLDEDGAPLAFPSPLQQAASLMRAGFRHARPVGDAILTVGSR